jgi:energy-coupling factor transporter ATP-binding protein EcfA2
MKILTDLNVLQGVTCIMVTHDTALKAYAHRVIRMVDGKISRIEEIPDFERTAALEALAASAPVQAMLAIESTTSRAAQLLDTTSLSLPVIPGRSVGSVNNTPAAIDTSLSSRVTRAVASIFYGMQDLLSRAGALDPPQRGNEENNARRLIGAGAEQLPSWSTATLTGTEDVSIVPVSTEGAATVMPVADAPPPADAGETIGLSITPRLVVQNSSSDTFLQSGVTSTGLSGVAAISHSLFVARSGGGSASSALAGQSTSHRVIRTPGSYATHQFAANSRKMSALEAEGLRRATAEKEARLRSALAAQHLARIGGGVG